MTMTDRATVVGVFTDRTQAERAIQTLENAGFADEQIGFIRRDGGTVAGEPDTGTGSNIAAGAVSGGVLGGILGAAASLLIPGLGPAIAGGILAATLGGVAIGAAAGGVIGALTNMGVSEEDARYYQGEFEAGRMLVTVRTPDPRYQQQAVAILRQFGAYDATTGAGAYNANAAPGTYAPNGTQGTYNPNTASAPYPNAAPETYNPNATQGTYNPNAAPGTYAPTNPGSANDPYARPTREDDILPQDSPRSPYSR